MSNIKLIQGSCVDQEVDAVVNAANGNMDHMSGVAGAIKQRAGNMIDIACHKYDLPIKDGEAIVTPAFNITNAKIVIHAVGPNFNRTPKAFKELFEAYYNSLLRLKENNYHTVAFALISASIFGGSLESPARESAKQCLRAYKKFTEDYPDYDVDVKLCAFTSSEYAEAIKEFKE